MALTTRTVYVILVAVTGLLYFLYVAYSSIYDGQFYRSTNIKGNLVKINKYFIVLYKYNQNPVISDLI